VAPCHALSSGTERFVGSAETTAELKVAKPWLPTATRIGSAQIVRKFAPTIV
jgi:hypothetical protein